MNIQIITTNTLKQQSELIKTLKKKKKKEQEVNLMKNKSTNKQIKRIIEYRDVCSMRYAS